jgi:hypothetical protein
MFKKKELPKLKPRAFISIRQALNPEQIAQFIFLTKCLNQAIVLKKVRRK